MKNTFLEVDSTNENTCPNAEIQFSKAKSELIINVNGNGNVGFDNNPYYED